MLHWKHPALAALLLSATVLLAARERHSNPAGTSESRSVPFQTTEPAPGPPAPVRTPRNSPLVVYNNPTYHIEFRYPRTYELSEEFPPAAWEPETPLNGGQPGSLLVASVLIPSDAYPNTTFARGSLQFIVNSSVPRETCESFAVPNDPTERDSTGSSTISGLPARWWQTGAFASHMGYTTRLYAVATANACYEFFLEIVDSIPAEPAHNLSRLDTAKVFRQLEKIISTLQIHPPAASSSKKPLAVVQSFNVERGTSTPLHYLLHVAWQVSGAADGEVFLRANCPTTAPISLDPLPVEDPPLSDFDPAHEAAVLAAPVESARPNQNGATPPSPVPPDSYALAQRISCGAFSPIPPAAKLRFLVSNNSPYPISFTLFAYHLNYITVSSH